MPNDILLVVLTFFVFLCAVAMCVQAVVVLRLSTETKQLKEMVSSVRPQLTSMLSKAELTLDENRKSIAEVTAKASEIAANIHTLTQTANQIAGKANDLMDSGKTQMARLDVVIADASERARVQLERAELVVDDTMSRVHQTVTAVHNGILKPVREIHGVAAGMRAALQTSCGAAVPPSPMPPTTTKCLSDKTSQGSHFIASPVLPASK